ncbi:phosphatase PAP2 family protein [Rothia sp. LK2588]|uniref:phosphatase PAP2 family protein n=1 Tax=Rothia sp. LK2588 TaxID=3114369 RepID=UPI0034CEDC87
MVRRNNAQYPLSPEAPVERRVTPDASVRAVPAKTDDTGPGTLRTPHQAHHARWNAVRRTRPSLWSIVQHIGALVILGTLFALSLWFFIRTAVGQDLDERALHEFSYRFMRFQTQTSSMLDLIPAAAGVLALVCIIFVIVWKHRFVPALVGLGVALAANASTQILKNFIVTKPDFGMQEAVMNSAPSGHTTFAASAGAALFLASPKKFRPVVAMIGAFFTLAAGFSTVVNAWHRPVDVVSAVLLTTIWTVIGMAILRFLRSEEMDLSDTKYTGLILVPLLSIIGFFVSFCAVAMYMVTYYDPIPGCALMAATCMIVAVIAFSTALQIALLRTKNKVRSAYTKVWTY